MQLQAQQPFHRPALGILVHERGHHMSVDDMYQGVSLRDDMYLVPFRAGLDECLEGIGLSERGNQFERSAAASARTARRGARNARARSSYSMPV